MNAVSKFQTITKTATEIAKSWTNREIAQFHYFNPNGLCAAKGVTDKKIDELVDNGFAKTGAIIAYGSLNYHYYDEMRKLIDKKRVNRVDLIAAIHGLRRNIESAEKFITEQVSN